MTTKLKILLSLSTLLLAFAIGRFTVPTKVVTVVKTVEVEKKVENKDAKEHQVVVIIKKPDGSETTTITKDKDTTTKETETDSKQTESSKTITKSESRIYISGLAGLSVLSSGTPVYGMSISKTIIGPITAGVFGFTNGVGGVSLGLTF